MLPRRRASAFRLHHLPLLIGVMSVGAGGCGGGGGGGNPNTPSPNSNRSPTVAISASRTFGIAQLTTFAFNATASDPDGDSVTIAWNFGDGTASSGTSVTKKYTNGGSLTVVATASDSKGASSVSGPLSVTVGSMTGTWSGTVDLDVCLSGVVKPVTAILKQTGGSISGTVTLSQGLCSFRPGTAKTDPAEPGTINGNGDVRIRVKIPPFTDVYFEGRMDSTGRRITGGLKGSGHRGTPFVLNKK